MKRKRKFSTGEGVYEGDGYAGVEAGMGGGAGYQGEGEYGPDVSGGNTSKPGESIESQTASQRQDMSPANYAELQNSVGIELGKDITEMLNGAGMLGKVGGVAGINAAIGNAIGMSIAKGTDYGTARRGDAGDPGENGDSRPGDTASDVKPFGSDAPTGTTKMEDEKGTGEKKYRWDPKLRQYVLENLGAGANPMGYRQGQVFQMAQGGQVPRSFAAGGAITPLDEATRNAVIAEAQRRATAAGTTPEAELYKYAQSQGLSNEDLDTYMGFGAGSSASWVQQNAGKYGVAAASGNSYVTPAPAPAPAPAPSPAPTGIAAGAGTAATPAAGGGITALNQTDRANVVSEAQRRATASGKTPEQELYNYATGLGYAPADIDTWMGFPAGTSALWASQNIGGNMVVTPTPGVTPGPAPGPSPDPTVDRTVTPAPGPTPGPTPAPAPDPYGGLTALDPTNRAAAVTEAQRLAGLSGRTPERELYNFATQKSGLNNGQIDRVMGFDNGTTDAWWAQQAGGGRDALANGGGGYGGGGSNFNNGGLDGLGIRNADGTRTLLGGVNDNAYDPRQYGWRTGLQAAAPAQQGPYIRGMAAGGIAAGAPAPRFVSGGGTGLSDEVPVTMDDGGEGRLADGEFVITADVVSGLGGGSSKAGAKMLYDMMERVRQQAHGSKKQIRPVDPKQVLPA